MPTNDLTPEEQAQVFSSRYTPLDLSNAFNSKMDMVFQNPYPESTLLETPEQIKEQVEKTPILTPINIKLEPKPVNDITFGFADQMFGGGLPTMYFHAGDSKPGVYSDMPDPKTMTHNILNRAKGYKPNKISSEIDNMDLSDDDKKYLKLLQHLESGSNYKVRNKYGYMGLYQFGKDALKTIKMDTDDYMSNSMNQHLAAIRLKDFNLQKAGLNKYVGKVIGGIKITENGLAAGLHLGGLGSVKKFLESNGKRIAIDRNNVPITAYITLFQ